MIISGFFVNGISTYQGIGEYPYHTNGKCTYRRGGKRLKVSVNFSGVVRGRLEKKRRLKQEIDNKTLLRYNHR